MTIGIGVIGAGVMGADHAATLAGAIGGAHLVAIADADSARATTLAQQTGAAAVFTDGAALIKDSRVDAVLVASPDQTHVDLVLACLEAGKPVLCEKPLAPTIEGCLKVMAAEMQLCRRLVQVGFMRRFDPGYVAMRSAFKAGSAGAAVMMHCVHRNAAVPSWFDATMVITNSAVHEIDIARWLLDDEMSAVTLFFPPRPGTVADRQFIVFETARGRLVDIELHLNAGYGYDVRAELVCETGTIALRPQAAVLTRAGGAEASGFAPDWRAHFAAAYRIQLQAWVESIRTGIPVGPSAFDGYAATATAGACLAALASGKKTAIGLQERPAFYKDPA